MKHRFALVNVLAAVMLAGTPTAHLQKKQGGPAAAARNVTITLVRWPYT